MTRNKTVLSVQTKSVFFCSGLIYYLCSNAQNGDCVNKVILVIMSDFKNARLAGLCAKETACEFFDDESLAEIELAVVETVNNCIEHAYAETDSHQIAIEFWATETEFCVEVVDRGKEIKAEQLEYIDANFDFDYSDIDNLPEGGMGLKIIYNCMDRVSYQNINGRNCWLLIKLFKSLK